MSLLTDGADFRGRMAAGSDADPAEPSLATVRDYIALLKPRVMSLVVFTALVGLAVAPGSVHPVTAFTALLCIAVGGGAAEGVCNCAARARRHDGAAGWYAGGDLLLGCGASAWLTRISRLFDLERSPAGPDV